MKIAVILIATGGRYAEHIAPMIASLRKYFPPCDVLLFTDSKDSFDAEKIDYPSLGWPDATMRRYHAILEQRGRLVTYDQVYYMDVDMRVVSKIELSEIFSEGITAVTHPGFPKAWERRTLSSACVRNGTVYYQGCFIGGSTGAFLQMCAAVCASIDADNERGITAVWFDESHMNRYLHDNPPGKILSPAYAYPEGWTGLTAKITHLKKHDQSWKDGNKIVRGFWTGKLTNIQKLCIRSYIKQGHEFHLYVSEPVEGIPEGTIVKDANEILSKDRLKEFDNSTHFCDYFRVLLILKEGGWYVDLDTICLRKLDFPEPYAFVSEEKLGARRSLDTPIIPSSPEVQEYLSGCVFKAPKDSPVLKYIADKIESMDKMHPASWISFGPALFKEAVPKFGLSKYVKAPLAFDAMRYDELLHFVTPGIKWAFANQSYLIHLRTSAWTGSVLVPDKVYPPNCLFEELKRKNGVGGSGRVSIIIPVYNMKEYLKESIESALAQTYRNFEVIVVDDGSMDNVHTVSQQFTDSIIWIRQENQGLNSARNTGAQAATGDLLLFLDADDKLDPAYLEKTVPLMIDGVGVVSTDMQYFGLSDLRIQTAETLEQQKVSNNMPYCVLIRREAFKQAGGYSSNPGIWAYGDWNLSLSILKDWKCAALHEPLFLYRMRPGSMRSIAGQTHEQMCETIRRSHPDIFPEAK